MNRRDFLAASAVWTSSACTAAEAVASSDGETLYNGIRLPSPWPPKMTAVPTAPVKFRFHLKKSRLFAFWVSPEKSGASHGYVAAGGPGFTGLVDDRGG